MRDRGPGRDQTAGRRTDVLERGDRRARLDLAAHVVDLAPRGLELRQRLAVRGPRRLFVARERAVLLRAQRRAVGLGLLELGEQRRPLLLDAPALIGDAGQELL